MGVHGDTCHTSYVVFESLKRIPPDSPLSRARACEDGRELELWRKLHAEWRGSAPQVIAAKARKFQDPQRCQPMQQLWEARPSWEQVGSEVLKGGYVVPEWVKAQTLDKLVPQLSVIVSRPEIADCGSQHKWNTHMAQHRPSRSPQLQHPRGIEMETSVWAQYSKMLPVDPRMLLRHLCYGTSKDNVPSLQLVATGMAVSVVNGAIMSLAKGKGKGRVLRKNTQKGATNRFAVLAEPDTHGTASSASHATSKAQRKTTGRSTKLGKRKKVSWTQSP